MIQEFENNIVVFFNTVPNYVGKGIIDLIAAIVGGVFIAWLTSTLFAKKSQIAETEGEILKKKVSIYEELAAKLEDLRNLNTIDENMRKAFMKVLKDASLETSNLSHRYVITIFSEPKTFTSTFLDIDKYITSHRIFYDDEVLKSAMILQNYLGAIRRIQSLYEQNIQSLKVSLDEPKSYKFETALMTELGILVEQEFSQLIDNVLESIRNSLDNLRLSHHKTIPHTAEFYGENGPILGALKYGIVEPSEAKITVKPRLSPRFIAKSHGNRYLCGSKQVSRSTTGILFQFKVWTLLACGVKIGRSMPYDRIHISKSRRLAY